jgi:hypothetical protein
MLETNMSTTTLDSSPLKSEYLAKLRWEIESHAKLDWATKELFLAEIAHHIDMLAASLPSTDSEGDSAGAKAVSLMERPDRLAQTLCRADAIGGRASPLRRYSLRLKSWAQFLELKRNLFLATVVSVLGAMVALFLGGFTPPSWQEWWIVPAVSATLVGLTIAAGSFLEKGVRPRFEPGQLLWIAFFAAGAELATYWAESVESLDSSLALTAAYGVFVLTMSFFSAIAFAAVYFCRNRLRWHFFRIAFPAVLAVFVLSAVLYRSLTNPDQGLLFLLLAVFGIVTIYSVRQYVASTARLETQPQSVTQ